MEHGGMFYTFAPEVWCADEGFRHQDDEWFHSDVCGFPVVGPQARSTIVIEGCEGPMDYTFVLLGGSHLYHDEFFGQHKEYLQGYAELTAEDVEWFTKRGCQKVRACAPAGSMILWHQKAIHATEKPEKGRPVHLPRFLVYGSYIPRSVVNPAARRKNLKAYYSEAPIPDIALRALKYV